jgi:hypothetical protein
MLCGSGFPAAINLQRSRCVGKPIPPWTKPLYLFHHTSVQSSAIVG